MTRSLLLIFALSILTACKPQEPAVDIWTAAATGNTGAIERHIRFGTDLDAKEPAGGSSPLIVAAAVGQTEVVRSLVANGANLEATNNDGSTALHSAAFLCHPETVKFLLEQGAKRNVTNRFGHTPLDTVSAEWSSQLKDTYQMFGQALQVELDLERIQKVRPQVAEMIRGHPDLRDQTLNPKS